MQSLTLHYLEDLGITAVDKGGPYVELFACEPGEAIAPDAVPFHVVNAWDYRAGRRREFAAGELEADIREAVEAYQ